LLFVGNTTWPSRTWLENQALVFFFGTGIRVDGLFFLHFTPNPFNSLTVISYYPTADEIQHHANTSSFEYD